MKHTYTLSFLVLSALALAGCSNSAEPASEPEPTAVTDLGTAIPPSASASSSSTASGGESGGPASTRTAPGHSQPVASAQGGAGAESAGALTAEEQAKVDAGEYVAATDKHPAFNVPVPVMPEAAKEKSAEGATAFLSYWADAMNYAMRTGDATLVRKATYEKSEYMSDNFDYFDAIEKHYAEGSWVVGNEDKHEAIPETYKEWGTSDSSVIDAVSYSSAGKSFDKNGHQTETLEPAEYNGKTINLTLHWNGESWQLENVSGKLDG